MSDLILVLTICHIYGIQERYFENNEKQSADNKMYEKLPSRQRVKGYFLLLTKHYVCATSDDY